ncbi:hypothetical protein I4U23_005877 [Adineta vaga]|nr:hypothetical protein I4U23_005877 [Adineta vaga]
MHSKRVNKQQDPLFCLALLPLCLSIGSFLFLNSAIISYIEERHNEKIYLNTTCYFNGTITFNEQCKDDICWWPSSTGLCPSTFRLCLKTVYVINYGNKQKAYTDKRPLWMKSESDDQVKTICYYDKMKSGILRWEKPKTRKFRIEILFSTCILISSIILWIVWFHLKKTVQLRIFSMNNYHLLQSEI